MTIYIEHAVFPSISFLKLTGIHFGPGRDVIMNFGTLGACNFAADESVTYFSLLTCQLSYVYICFLALAIFLVLLGSSDTTLLVSSRSRLV